jgi:hypothetical protein
MHACLGLYLLSATLVSKTFIHATQFSEGKLGVKFKPFSKV